MLETKDITRVVHEKTIVNGVSVQVHAGELMMIVGSSGAGKSSFLRLLNRLDEPTSGSVLLKGQDYRTLPPQALRQQVGMVMQQPYLFPGTVQDNIQFGPQQRGEQLTNNEIEELLERMLLAGFRLRDVGQLSAGEAQRVSLARTLVNQPHVLLLDEITSALDETARLEVENLVSSIIREQQVAGLWVTHDLEQARRIADRVMLLEQGQLQQVGSPTEVLHAISTLS